MIELVEILKLGLTKEYSMDNIFNFFKIEYIKTSRYDKRIEICFKIKEENRMYVCELTNNNSIPLRFIYPKYIKQEMNIRECLLEVINNPYLRHTIKKNYKTFRLKNLLLDNPQYDYRNLVPNRDRPILFSNHLTCKLNKELINHLKITCPEELDIIKLMNI